MELKTLWAQDPEGNTLPGAEVFVYEAGTTTIATGLRGADGIAITNPFYADEDGKIAFKAPDGLYDILVRKEGRERTLESVQFFDAAAARLDIGDRVLAVSSISEIEELEPVEGKQVSLSGSRGGLFSFVDTDLSAEVSADPLQGIYIAPTSDPTGASGAWVRTATDPSGRQIDLVSLGFGGAGQAANNAAFSQALAMVRAAKSAGAAYGEIIIPGGEHHMSGYFLIPPYARIRPQGAAIIKHYGGGTFWHIAYDSDEDPEAFPQGPSQNPYNCGSVVDGSTGSIAIKGFKDSGSIGLELGLRSGAGNSRTHTAWMDISNLVVDGFDVNLHFNNVSVFLTRFYNCMFTGANTIIDTAPLPSVNSGEQINFVSCAFHNSARIGRLRTPMNLEFHGCSFDYMSGDDGLVVEADYQRVSLFGGWVEGYSGTQEGVFIRSMTGANARRLHVDINGVYIQPRDKKQCRLVVGPAAVSFVNNTIVVNRNQNYPESCDAQYHYMFGDETWVRASGNKWLDAMVSLHHGIGNRNPDFADDAAGTTATLTTPDAVSGWTILGAAGQSDVEVVSVAESPSGTALRIDSASGTYCNITSDPIPVAPGDFVHQNLAIYSPADGDVNLTMQIVFYDDSGTAFKTNTYYDNQASLPADKFVTAKNGHSIPVPAGAVRAAARFILGNYSSDIYVYGAGIQVV